MGFSAFEEEFGTEAVADMEYATAPLNGRDVTLKVDLFLPARARRDAPLVVWLGRETSRSGSHSHAGHRRLARWLTRDGIALATPACRNGGREEDLDPGLMRWLDRIDASRDPKAPEEMSSAAAMAAMEDLCCFLFWLEAERTHLGLSPHVTLAGPGLGAVTAFNSAFLAPALGIARPKIDGIVSFSGGLAWPGLYEPGRFGVFALHDPSDHRIPIDTIRKIAKQDPMVELIETVDRGHGALGVSANEGREASFRRIAGLARRWSSGSAVPETTPMEP